MFLNLFLGCLILGAYPVVIYPGLVVALARLRRRGWRCSPWKDHVSHIITVHNEEARIREKLDHTLEIDGPAGGIETIVVDDGSTDGTESIVREYAARGVRWIAHARQGKEAAQIAAVRASSGTVIVFSDASTRIEKDAIPALLEPFADLEVAGVSGTDRPEIRGSSTGEELYVSFEMALRRAESRAGSLVGMSGCFFAVRREIAERLLPDVPSDLGSALLCIQSGKRAVAQEKAICRYGTTVEPEREFARKRRTALRGLRCLWTYRHAISWKRPLISWQIISHKVLRFLSPFFLAAGIGFLFAGAVHKDPLAMEILLGVAVVASFVALSYPYPSLRRFRLMRAAGFFLMSNLAVVAAWADLLTGRKLAVWIPTSRS